MRERRPLMRRQRRGTEAAAARSGEGGTAFLLAIICLVVLTLLGLSLSMLTQNELSLGDRERSAERALYAAEAGFSPAIARALLDGDHSAQVFSVQEVNGLGLHNEVDVSSFYPVLAMPCDLCEVHNTGVYNHDQFYEVTHAVSSRGRRLGNGEKASGAIAEKELSVMVDVLPTGLRADTFHSILGEGVPADIPY
jgi:hypothetical protein